MKIKDLVERYGDTEVPKKVLDELGIKSSGRRRFKYGECLYFICPWYEVVETQEKGGIFNENLFKTRNYYPCSEYTIEQVKAIAQRKQEYDMAVATLKDAIEEANDGWKPNWEDTNERKYFICFCYNMKNEILVDFYYNLKHFEDWYYIKSRELAEEIATKYEKEIKIYFKGWEEYDN